MESCLFKIGGNKNETDLAALERIPTILCFMTRILWRCIKIFKVVNVK